MITFFYVLLCYGQSSGSSFLSFTWQKLKTTHQVHIPVVILEKSLNSVKVLEKYWISLLGNEKSLKFTRFLCQKPFSVRLYYFAEENLAYPWCILYMSEPVKRTGDVKKNFVHERYLQ